MERPAYYGILPANIRYDKRLKPMEKIMYSEITALANKNGYCNAGNAYFAELYEVDKSTVSRWIKSLINNGYLSIQLIYREGTKEVLSRKIFIDTPIDLKVNTPPQKSQYPIDQKVKDNNTSINNTSNNNNKKNVVASTLRNEIKLIIASRNIKIDSIIKLDKPIKRIKEVFDYCNKYEKEDGWLIKSLKEDWELKPPKEQVKEPYRPEREYLN